MPNKNSLANKKRKKIKYDGATISGFLLAGSEKNETSDNSLDSTDFNIISISNKKRLSTEFDDSFDLFKNRKITNENNLKNSPKKKSASPVKNSPVKNSSPSKTKSPRAKKLIKSVNKCGYFEKSPSLLVPCPFCFKFEDDIFTHISSNCNKPCGVNDEKVAELIEIHTDYWSLRRNLGIPDVTINENELFKSTVQLQKTSFENTSESLSSNCKIPFLKWNSKSKKSKYLLLRQNKADRENKITQKLAILLMGNEDKEESENPEKRLSNSSKKVLKSNTLSEILSKEPKFWNKAQICPDQVMEETFYIKALAPFIAPEAKKLSQCSAPAVPQETKALEEGDAEVANIFSYPADSPVGKDSYFAPLNVNSLSQQKSELKDSCFTETDISECKENETFRLQISKNWGKMLNCSDLSDTIVTFMDGTLYCHSLVFYANSIKIFRSISSCSDKETGKILDWKEIPSSAGTAFIKYIYTGEINHFDSLNSSDLETVHVLCEYYEEYNLKNYLNKINCKNSKSDDIKDSSRGFISPDIFDDSEPNSPLNTTFTVNKDLIEDSNSSKRKLESPNFTDDECSKKAKTESDIEIKSNFNDKKSSKIIEEKDDVVSISSEDNGSLSSALTMSPGKYEKLMKRPISNCSTLPPLSESPKNEENGTSPLPFTDSPEFNTIVSNNIPDEDTIENEYKENSKSPDCNRYYDNDIFDYNEYELIASQQDISPTSPKNFDVNESIKSTRNSLDKYFDESIPEFFESPVVRCKTPLSIQNDEKDSPAVKGLCQSTPTQPINTGMMTPSPQILISDKVTPMLDYSNLISPELKGELKRYGLKPDMDRKKAKTLLRYIYDLIHPVIPGSENQNPIESIEDQTTPRKDNDNLGLNPADIDSIELNENDEETENKAETSTESILAHDSEENSGEFDFECSQHSPGSPGKNSYLTKNDLLHVVTEFVKSDNLLFESTLMYVPVWLSKFHQALKEKGIKCTKNDLMDVLDELCITFRTEKKPRENKRKKKKSR